MSGNMDKGLKVKFSWKAMIEWLIHDRLKEASYIHRRAKVLANIHVFILLFSVFLVLTTIFVPDQPMAPLLIGVALLALALFLFRRYGNLNLSGNILALIWALVLAPTVPDTGGIVSDNLLWLVIAPLMVFLFADRKYGIMWTIALLSFTVSIFLTGDPSNLGFELDGGYYFVSYSTLFVTILAIIVIFQTGLERIIKLLNEKQEQLLAQKKEIEEKAEELRATQEELKATNQELEHFAYAASHDLKEPLRMIGTYTQLIQKRLKSQLDEPSTEYMHYVTDGVSRMQKLLDDLLEYSRLGKSQNFKNIDLNNTLLVVMNNLMMRMSESNASIFANRLPTIYSSSSEMMQLFQNLISNAIKFRSPTTVPEIRIRAEDKPDHYLISLQDNGIGIPEEHQKKVFAMFERLHSKSEFEGTGIGLSTCKKIITNMGGKIWLTSKEGVGTTFFFTIPKKEQNADMAPSFAGTQN